MKPDLVGAWAAETLPGETVRTYVRAGSQAGPKVEALDGSAPGSSPDRGYEIWAHGRLRGLDDAQRLLPLEIPLVVLTDRQLHFVSVGGLRPRPKELLYSFDRGDVRCQWFDYEEAKTRYRNWLFLVNDGRWLAVAAQTKLLGKTTKLSEIADAFVEELAAAAVEIDWRNPPPL